MAKKLDDVFDLFVPDTARARPDTRDPLAIATAVSAGDLTCANLSWNTAASIARSGHSVTLFCDSPTTSPVWPREETPRGLCLRRAPRSDVRLAAEMARVDRAQVVFIALPWARLARAAAKGLRLDLFLRFACGNAAKDVAHTECELPGVRQIRVSVDRSGGRDVDAMLCLDDLFRAVAVRRGLPENCVLSRQLDDLTRKLIESARL